MGVFAQQRLFSAPFRGPVLRAQQVKGNSDLQKRVVLKKRESRV